MIRRQAMKIIRKTKNGCEESEKALEKAAKFICNLKCGLCPLREKDFQGCPYECTEEIKPWQCWVAHFKRLQQRPAG